MSELTPEIAQDLVAACNANVADIASALERSIDAAVTVSVGESKPLDLGELPAGFDGPGLAALLQYGEVAVVAVLPESEAFTPNWLAKPDISGEGKLNTLAQELSMLVVPESLLADKFAAAWVDNLAEKVKGAEPAEGAQLVPLTLKATEGDAEAELTLLWPCTAPSKLLPKPRLPDSDATNEAAPTRKPTCLEELPAYAQHLLKIEVPVTVTMVSKKLSIQEVIELGPGAMITFDKSCDSPLELAVGDQQIALGSAVKVGENFGLEITEMTLPREHFLPAKRA